MLEIGYVIETHRAILEEFGGLPGFAGTGRGGVEAALARVENHAFYNGINDVFGIVAMYLLAIARGHVFNDGNKRTGLTCALAYLEREGCPIQRTPELEEVVVMVARGGINHDVLASYFGTLWSRVHE